MERHDLQIVRRVLGVVHGVDKIETDHPDFKMVQHDDGFDGAAVLEYDLNRHPPVRLPSLVAHRSEMVERHLRNIDSTDPWGLIDDKLVILRLENHPFSASGRLLLFSDSFIADNLKKWFPNSKITKAERRVLLQSMSGVALKNAAELDCVSYETKKSQLKSVFQKTHFNSQQTLSNFLITHLTLELASNRSRKSVDAESDDMFFYYVDTYMGSYVRASVVQNSPGQRFRIIELGDPSGTPVVCVHHLGIINFSEEEIGYLHRNRIRLICPLRHGALGPADPRITTEEHMKHAISGIDLAVSLGGQNDTIVLSLLSGCLYAINYFEAHAKTDAKLIMLGASYKTPTSDKVASPFKKNLHDLANENERTLELTVSTMLESVNQPHRLKKVVQESHNNGNADNRTIDELFSDQTQVMAMRHRLSNSPLSIVQDLKMQSAKDWAPLKRISPEVDIHFIHGSKDEVIPIENILNLVEQNSGMQLHVVEEAGNWIFGRYTNQTTSIIRGILEKSN